ncbi:hypothetical protein [Streptomyces sp. OV198]|uniref:hypothetical protein n=1 Tax=Streptomyces sp. OV198 TaxID=1882787 RepID=UPI00117CC76B|nr:hypothetical protein [Streptomyces sp. OV198]
MSAPLGMTAADTSEPGPGTDRAIAAIALLAMFAQMERIYMLARAADGRAVREARGLPTGRPAKLNATTRAGAAQRTNGGATPEQVVAELGGSRSPLHAVPRATQAPPTPCDACYR